MNTFYLYFLMVNNFLAIDLQKSEIQFFHKANYYSKKDRSNNQKTSNKAIKKTKNEVFRKFGLKCIGVGAGGDYEKLSLEFYYYEPLEVDKARFLTLQCSEIFKKNILEASAINSEKELIDYNPIIGITIYSVDKNYNHYPDPLICVVRIDSQGLLYRTDDPENEFKYKNTFTETLEEAEFKNQEYLQQLQEKRQSGL